MSNLISKDGFEKLKAEWEHLKYTERPSIQQRVSDAAAEGDRSENAEYTYGRMRLREIDKRLRFLDKILDNAKIVENISSNDGSSRFGAKVSLQEIKTKKIKNYTLVGPQEIDPLQGKISISSPVGKVLIGKKQGDTVQVSVPKGILEYQIIEVSYK